MLEEDGINGVAAPKVNGGAYPIIDHTFDVVVVGAGGAGLRATVGCSQAGLAHRLHHQGVPDPLAHRRGAGRHLRRARQHGRRTTGAGTCTTPSRGRTGSATRTRSSISCRNAPAAVYELEHWGVPFSRTEDGKIYQRPFGGMTTDYGKGTGAAHLRRRRPHRPRHPAHALRPGAPAPDRVLHRVLRHRPDHGRGRALPRRRRAEARRRHDPSLPRPHDDPRHRRLRPRLFLRDLGPHLHRRRQRHGAARRPAAAGHGVRAVPPDRHLRRRLPHHRGRARRGRLSHQFRGRALHGALRAVREGPRLARRRLARHDDGDPRGPRRRQGEGPHPPPPRPPRPEDPARAPARHLGEREDLRRRRRHAASRSRSCRPCTTTWAASRRTITARC